MDLWIERIGLTRSQPAEFWRNRTRLRRTLERIPATRPDYSGRRRFNSEPNEGGHAPYMLFTHNHCIGSRSMCGHQILRPVIGGFNYRHSQSTTAANSGFCSRKLLEIGGGVWLLGWGCAYDCWLCRWIESQSRVSELR